MKNVEPKDRPKLYALIGAAVIVFCIVIFVTIKSIADVSPPSHPPVAEATPTPAASTSAAGGAANPAPVDGFIVDRPIRQGRDPFMVVPDDRLAQSSVRIGVLGPPIKPKVTAPTIARTSFGVLPSPVGPGVKKILATGRSGFGDAFREAVNVGQQNPTVTVFAPEAPPYAVTGVLIGEPGGHDVAILHRTAGADEKRYVVVGDVLDGGYTVTAIESDGIRVRTSGRRMVSDPSGASTPGTEIFVKRELVTIPLGDAGTPRAK